MPPLTEIDEEGTVFRLTCSAFSEIIRNYRCRRVVGRGTLVRRRRTWAAARFELRCRRSFGGDPDLFASVRIWGTGCIQLLRLNVLPSFRHSKTGPKSSEGWNKTKAHLNSPNSIQLVVVSALQCPAEAFKNDDRGDGTCKCTLEDRTKSVEVHHWIC